VDAPIIEGIYRVIHEGADPKAVTLQVRNAVVNRAPFYASRVEEALYPASMDLGVLCRRGPACKLRIPHTLHAVCRWGLPCVALLLWQSICLLCGVL